MNPRARWHPEDDPEYMAETDRAMRSVSWGCVLFVLGIGLTGVGPSNIKCYDAERIVSGGINEHTIQQAAQAAAADSSPRSDHRGSEEYKREMVAVCVRRSLMAAAGMRAA